jgi:hypothetical protein
MRHVTVLSAHHMYIDSGGVSTTTCCSGSVLRHCCMIAQLVMRPLCFILYCALLRVWHTPFKCRINVFA